PSFLTFLTSSLTTKNGWLSESAIWRLTINPASGRAVDISPRTFPPIADGSWTTLHSTCEASPWNGIPFFSSDDEGCPHLSRQRKWPIGRGPFPGFAVSHVNGFSDKSRKWKSTMEPP